MFLSDVFFYVIVGEGRFISFLEVEFGDKFIFDVMFFILGVWVVLKVKNKVVICFGKYL